jgi:hypothetical protein
VYPVIKKIDEFRKYQTNHDRKHYHINFEFMAGYHKDYSLRVHLENINEVGILTKKNTFNDFKLKFLQNELQYEENHLFESEWSVALLICRARIQKSMLNFDHGVDHNLGQENCELIDEVELKKLTNSHNVFFRIDSNIEDRSIYT